MRNLLRLLIFLVLASNTGLVFSQQDTVTFKPDLSSEIDTSEYLPMFYEGALDYNLMIAAYKGYPSEVIRLIGLGADVNTQTPEGVTPVIYAVMDNKLNTLKVLLKYHPDLDKLTSSFETALIIAVKDNNFEICETLIRAGADIDAPDRNGATPLHYAAIFGYFDIVDLLLYYDASIDQKSDDDITPLFASVMAGYADVADLLIQHGANMESRNESGLTPFLMASINGDTLIMSLLRKFGVDIYTVNNENYSALDLTIAYGRIAAEDYLLRNGTNWTENVANAVNPYEVASKYNRKDAVALLKKYNVPGKIKYGIDQISVSVSSRFTFKDCLTGPVFSFKEPYINGGIIAGIDMKLWYTRVLIKDSESLFHQYFNKSYLIYAGVFKDIILHNDPDRYNLVLSASLMGGYSFGNVLRGTLNVPGNEFKVIPDLSMRMQHRRTSFSLGMEYIKTPYYNSGPLWLRAGLSYTMFFDRIRTEVKPIKWR
jgi:ankyrin repeat protein